MTPGYKLLALCTLAILIAASAEARAQHTVRRVASTAGVYSGGGHTSCGCHDCMPQVNAAPDCCGGCNTCCPSLCLPNPCVVIDRVGTALYGLRELFRGPCCCCPDPCCHGAIQEEMPYLDHYRTVPPQPRVAPEPVPAQRTDAARRMPVYPQSPSTSANSIREQRYRKSSTVQQTGHVTWPAAPTVHVERTSFEAPVPMEPVAAKPRGASQGASNRPAAKLHIAKEAPGNPVR